MSDIQTCLDLISQLPNEYKNKDMTTIVYTTPDKILEISTMALWAQSTVGTKEINPRLPSLSCWLKRLAANGPGPDGEYEGVKYKFVKRKFHYRQLEELSLISLQRDRAAEQLLLCQV